MKIKILAWLLHHANRKYSNPEFYEIKNYILKYYGMFICYEVQFIEGKKCYSCDGTGIYVGYKWSDIHWGKLVSYQESCYKCYQGWYKRPTWNILSKMQLGKYTFHQPWQRIYVKPNADLGKVIEGYIEHEKSKYSDLAATILFLIYEKEYLKRWYKNAGIGFRIYWWYPKNWPNNIVYFLKQRNKLSELPF